MTASGYTHDDGLIALDQPGGDAKSQSECLITARAANLVNSAVINPDTAIANLGAFDPSAAGRRIHYDGTVVMVRT